MEKIKVYIDWCHKNYCGGFSDNVPGAAVFTGDTYEDMKREAQETLDFHMQGYVEDGEAPQWYLDHDYELEFHPTTVAVLQASSGMTTLAAISREANINQNQLCHYATGKKTPRPTQRQRIIDSIHAIGRRLLAV